MIKIILNPPPTSYYSFCIFCMVGIKYTYNGTHRLIRDCSCLTRYLNFVIWITIMLNSWKSYLGERCGLKRKKKILNTFHIFFNS